MTHDHDACCGGHDPSPPAPPTDSPILVEVTRGGMVESVHRGRACIVDAAGRVLARWGDIDRPVYARSAIKALQAIPLVESGALDAYGLGDAELALACSSHSAEPLHTARVAAWLARIGCTSADLECGVHLPYDADTAHDMIRRGEAPSTLHNNCSGKHAGMLTTARHKGERTAGYVRLDHPVQQRILGVLEQMTGQDLSDAPRGIDGCSIPTLAIPLGAIALAMARIADPVDLPDRRAAAVARIQGAWAAHPRLIGGAGTFDTRMIALAAGRVLTKVGAEGVCCAVIPEAGVGIALKIDDGTGRARDVAMAALVRAARVLDTADWARDPTLLETPLPNRRGAEVGVMRPAQGWPGA